MKKFKFRLAKVLEHRATLTAEFRRELMFKNRELQEAEEKLGELLESVAGNTLASDTQMSSDLVELAGMYTQRLKREIDAQRFAIVDAREAVEVAQNDYIEAKKEERVLVTLEERQRAEYMAIVAKHEQSALDELVTQRAGRIINAQKKALNVMEFEHRDPSKDHH